MNGALVIPKLMCIKFCRVFFQRNQLSVDIKKARVRLHDAGLGTREKQLAEGFKGFHPLQMRRDIFKLMGLLFIPDNFIVMVQNARRERWLSSASSWRESTTRQRSRFFSRKLLTHLVAMSAYSSGRSILPSMFSCGNRFGLNTT